MPNPTFVSDTNKFMGSIGITLPKDWPIIGGSRLTLPTNSDIVKFTFFLNTDGTLCPLRGATETALTLPAVTLAQSGTRYLCIAANSHGLMLQSCAAALTVSDMPPVTGDASQATGWLALLAVSSLILVALAVRRKGHGRR